MNFPVAMIQNKRILRSDHLLLICVHQVRTPRSVTAALFVAYFERSDCGATVTFDDIRIIKDEIRTSYAVPVRDFLEFTYRETFPANESARVAFALGHYNFFLSALSRNASELTPHREMLRRLCRRHEAPLGVLDDVNRALVFEMMKMTAFQRRNSPDAAAAYNLVIADIAHVLWSTMAEPTPQHIEAA